MAMSLADDDPWSPRNRPADPEELAAEEDRRIRDQFDEPDIWPDDDRQRQYHIARERAPQPRVPLQRPSQKGDQK
jgi:hypothetical protein